MARRALASKGVDGLPNEFIKRAAGEEFRSAALGIVNTALATGEVFAEWRDCVIVPIHKPKKDKLFYDSYVVGRPHRIWSSAWLLHYPPGLTRGAATAERYIGHVTRMTFTHIQKRIFHSKPP